MQQAIRVRSDLRNSLAMATGAMVAAPSRVVKVAVAQMTAVGNVDANFVTCARLAQVSFIVALYVSLSLARWIEYVFERFEFDRAEMANGSGMELLFVKWKCMSRQTEEVRFREAAEAGVRLLSLPECFSFIGAKQGESLKIAEPMTGPIMRRYQSLAREAGLWLALGGFQEKGPDNNHHYNTHVLLDDMGNIRSAYRKIHLFDVDVPGGPVLQESNTTASGTEVVAADSPAGRLGLTVCYDLRFPELYQRLRFAENCEVLLVPSAFTKTTGEVHWELLLRARAVETQCYVLAAAQAGKHNEKRESYGDAIIVDPWGKVIARLPDKLQTGLAIADIDHSVLHNVRLRMPIEQHRRYDIYAPSSCVEPPRTVSGKPSSL